MQSLTIFTSPTCGPCRILKPKLKAFCERNGLALTELSIADPVGRDAAKKLGLRGVPAVVRGDQVLFMGNIDEPAITACLQANGVL